MLHCRVARIKTNQIAAARVAATQRAPPPVQEVVPAQAVQDQAAEQVAVLAAQEVVDPGEAALGEADHKPSLTIT